MKTRRAPTSFMSANEIRVYLCGPINGCTDEECKDWREEMKQHFPDAIDPMRRDYRGKEAESYREIVELDKIDVERADVVLVNFPGPSTGTDMEILHAWNHRIPVIAVIPPGLRISPWLRYHATKIVHSFDEASLWISRI